MLTLGSAAVIGWQLGCSPWWWLGQRNTCLLLWSKAEDKHWHIINDLHIKQLALFSFCSVIRVSLLSICSHFSAFGRTLNYEYTFSCTRLQSNWCYVNHLMENITHIIFSKHREAEEGSQVGQSLDLSATTRAQRFGTPQRQRCYLHRGAMNETHI